MNERRRERVFTDLDLGYFWAWTDFTSYLEFIMSVAAIGNKIHLIYWCNVKTYMKMS